LEDQLSGLILESGVKACRYDDGRFNVAHIGRLRPWDIAVWLSNGWICMRTTLLRLPSAHGARSEVMAAALALNNNISCVKIALAWENVLVIDLQCRAEQVDGPALANLIGLVYHVAEERYGRLAEIAAGTGTLTALAAAFDRSPAAQ